ncbi:hypothetical protein [Metaclostridioides mangenotii]|uniref:hypothetical protein n=1 Tax=Metaclostridioides mangenotii TaxID=1540 RepID=UPI00046415DC|nr:hypothetical protein [Clostridioides mangenotii]
MNNISKPKDLYNNGYKCIYYNKINSKHTVYLKNFESEKSETVEFSNDTDFNDFKDYITSQRFY